MIPTYCPRCGAKPIASIQMVANFPHPIHHCDECELDFLTISGEELGEQVKRVSTNTPCSFCGDENHERRFCPSLTNAMEQDIRAMTKGLKRIR